MDEGYIKYQCLWEHTTPVSNKAITSLITYRQKAFGKKWIGVYPDGIGYGNISIRTDENQFIISGSATGRKKHLEAGDFALVTAFDHEQNWLKCHGPVQASSESMTHGVIYRTRSEVQAVIHVHHRQAWLKMLQYFPTTPKTVAYGTPEMARAIMGLLEASIESNGLIVMGGHEEGILAYGSNLETAWQQLKILDNYDL